MTREEALQNLTGVLEGYREGVDVASTAWMLIRIVVKVGDAGLLEMAPTKVRQYVEHLVSVFRHEGQCRVYLGAEGEPGLKDVGSQLSRLSELIDQAGTSTTWKVFRR